MPPCELDLLAKLPYHIHVNRSDDARQRGADHVFPAPVDDPAVDAPQERVRGCLPAGYRVHHVAVALAVRGGHIVAQADVAPLERGVQPGQLVDDVVVEVEDAPVVLVQPLDAFLRDIAAAHQAFEDARRYSLGVLHVALLSRKLADEVRVHQLLLHIGVYHPPHRHPVHARALHPHLRHPVLHDDAYHALQLRGQDTELFLKNNSFLIEWAMSRFCEEKYSFGRSAATDQKEDFSDANPQGLTLTATAERATFAALFSFWGMTRRRNYFLTTPQKARKR